MKRVALVTLLAAACATAQKPAPATGEKSDTAESPEAAAPAPKRMVVRWERSEQPAPLPAVARTEPKSQRYKLGNGIDLVVVEHHQRRIVSTRLIFPTGAAADPPERSGATWLAVSLLGATFDEVDDLGRPRQYDEKSVARLVAEQGGAWEWGASEDQAWIGVDGYSADVTAYLTRLADVVRERRHGEASFTGRMQSITDAMNELDVSDSSVLIEHLGRLAFGTSHPYSRPIYGTPASLSELTLAEVTDRQESLLDPRGATLLVVGDVRPDVVFRAAQKALGAWKNGEPKLQPVKVSPPRVEKRRSVTFLPRKPARITTLCAARPLSDVTANEAELDVLGALVAAKLENVLREQARLTYSASAAIQRYRSAQALLACSGVVFNESATGLQKFQLALQSAAVAPAAEDLARVKAGLIAWRERALDDVPSTVAMWQDALARGVPVTPQKYVEAVKAVTPERIAELAVKVLEPAKLQWAVSGETEQVTPAVKAAGLGKLVTPKLDKVESRAGDDEHDPER